MGFEFIQTLRGYIERLQTNPEVYQTIISEWKQLKKITPNRAQELNFMITLFNRFYLNHHPDPNPVHIQKYIEPRYVTGSMHRNIMDQISPETEKNTIEFHLTSAEPGSREHTVLSELNDYTKQFIGKYL